MPGWKRGKGKEGALSSGRKLTQGGSGAMSLLPPGYGMGRERSNESLSFYQWYFEGNLVEI